MKPTLKILHLEDLQSDSDLINVQLNNADMPFENLMVDTKTGFISALQNFHPDIILADHPGTSFNSMEALKIVKESKTGIPFLLVTTTASDEFINNLVEEGAKGYISKDKLIDLPEAIKKALNKDFYKEVNESFAETIFLEEKLYDLKMLEEMDDQAYLSEILSIFLEETPRDLKEMKKAAASKKIDVVSGKAHKLKSSSGLLEAHKLSNLLEQIEEITKCGIWSNELITLVDAANGEYLKIERSLKTYLKAILK